MSNIQELSIPIRGMHCKSCTIVVADQLEKIPGVKEASVNLSTNIATIKFTTEPKYSEIEDAITKAGYKIGSKEDKEPVFSSNKTVYKHFAISMIIVVVIYLLIRGKDITNFEFAGLSSNEGLLSLVIGITAGFSTCMALVGGLVLGLSSRFAEKHPSATTIQKFRPHLFFNLGRITTFFVLGGAIGALGSIVKFNSTATGYLTVIVGMVMIYIGLQLTELLPRLSKNKLSLPTGISKALGLKKHREKEYSHKNAIILGSLSFFLPCGFTQAMQLVAINSGSFVTGSLVMGLFAVGTAPGLLSIGGITSIIKGNHAKVVFRFIGVVVIALALYNIFNGFNLIGVQLSNIKFPTNQTNLVSKDNQPVQSNNSPSSKSANSTISDSKPIVLKATFTLNDYIEPKDFNVSAGKSYILEIDPKDDGRGCMSTVMIPELYNTPQLIVKGKKLQIPFTIKEKGVYKITCAMGIPFGSINAN